MPVPARTPVIVGRAQIVDTEPDLDNPTDPIQLMTRAAAAAVADAGIDASSIDLVGVVAGLFRHPNPGRAIGDAIGIPASATSVLTTWGGNTPIAFVGELGDRLARGEADMIVMVGGETGLTRAALRKAGLPSPAVIRESPIEEASIPASATAAAAARVINWIGSVGLSRSGVVLTIWERPTITGVRGGTGIRVG